MIIDISGYVGGFMGREMDKRGYLWNLRYLCWWLCLLIDKLLSTPFISKDLKIWPYKYYFLTCMFIRFHIGL